MWLLWPLGVHVWHLLLCKAFSNHCQLLSVMIRYILSCKFKSTLKTMSYSIYYDVAIYVDNDIDAYKAIWKVCTATTSFKPLKTSFYTFKSDTFSIIIHGLLWFWQYILTFTQAWLWGSFYYTAGIFPGSWWIIVRIRINFICRACVHTCKGFRPYCFENIVVNCLWSNTNLNVNARWKTSFHVSLEINCVVSFYFEGKSVRQEIVLLAISISLMHFPLPESDWLFHSRLQALFRLWLHCSTVKIFFRTPQWKYTENAFFCRNKTCIFNMSDIKMP